MKRNIKDDVKNKLIRSLIESDVFENDQLALRADNVSNYEEVIPIVKEHETVIRLKKKSILNVASRQDIIFERFKESEKFVEMVKELGVSKSTIYFKFNFILFLGKYLKLKKFPLSLNFLKTLSKNNMRIKWE